MNYYLIKCTKRYDGTVHYIKVWVYYSNSKDIWRLGRLANQKSLWSKTNVIIRDNPLKKILQKVQKVLQDLTFLLSIHITIPIFSLGFDPWAFISIWEGIQIFLKQYFTYFRSSKVSGPGQEFKEFNLLKYLVVTDPHSSRYEIQEDIFKYNNKSSLIMYE